MRGIFVFLCLFGILEIANAAPDTAGTLEDLHAHRFDAMEQRFEAIDESFRRGSISEFDLLDAYKPFYQRDDILSQDMTAWVRAHPKSYVAHLANGTYRRKLGEFQRGEGYNQNVPLDVQGYVTQQFKMSQRELWLALELKPESFLAMLNLLNIARYEDDDMLAKKMLALAPYPTQVTY